jgi:hypothetical protein
VPGRSNGENTNIREADMATFYVLPPRPLVGQRLLDHLQPLFPGLAWAGHFGVVLVEALAAAACEHPDVYVVYREELPGGEEVGQALRDGFGAEPGDTVVEVRPGPEPGALSARSWRLV